MKFSEEAQREIDRTNAQCRKWADWLKEAGYSVCAMWAADTSDDPFGYEWQIWTDDRDWWLGPIATIYNHGTGPEWAGDYGPYNKVVKPKMREIEDLEDDGEPVDPIWSLTR
jgi:hypothetical protein